MHLLQGHLNIFELQQCPVLRWKFLFFEFLFNQTFGTAKKKHLLDFKKKCKCFNQMTFCLRLFNASSVFFAIV